MIMHLQCNEDVQPGHTSTHWERPMAWRCAHTYSKLDIAACTLTLTQEALMQDIHGLVGKWLVSPPASWQKASPQQHPMTSIDEVRAGCLGTVADPTDI